MIEVGLPRKKRYFDLLTENDINGNCFLDCSILYLSKWDCSIEDSPSYQIKVINLNVFDGNEKSHPFIIESSTDTYDACSVDGYIYLSSEYSCILEKGSQKVLFSEKEDEIPSDWAAIRGGIIRDNNYYRWVDRKDNIKIDIWNIADKKILGRFDIDLKNASFVGDSLMGGTRPNGNFAIFSITENRNIFELDSQKYFNCIPAHQIHFAQSGNKLALACNDSIVVLDLGELEVIKHINCLQHEAIQAVIQQYNSKESKLAVSEISFAENVVIISGGRRISYVMCIDIVNEHKPIRWVHTGFDDNHTKYIGGDLIFGIEDSRPVAWDVYTGEMVWQASAGTIANCIQIGDGWVVYSQISGYIQCFKWTKPYISPHRSET
jgi:hypothetical protein